MEGWRCWVSHVARALPIGSGMPDFQGSRAISRHTAVGLVVFSFQNLLLIMVFKHFRPPSSSLSKGRGERMVNRISR